MLVEECEDWDATPPCECPRYRPACDIVAECDCGLDELLGSR